MKVPFEIWVIQLRLSKWWRCLLINDIVDNFKTSLSEYFVQILELFSCLFLQLNFTLFRFSRLLMKVVALHCLLFELHIPSLSHFYPSFASDFVVWVGTLVQYILVPPVCLNTSIECLIMYYDWYGLEILNILGDTRLLKTHGFRNEFVS